MSGGKNKGTPSQLELPLFSAEAPRARAAEPVSRAAPAPAPSAPRPSGLRVIQGGGQRVHEKLESRDAVVRVLVEAGADLLLRRISPERASEIEGKVDRILGLFDKVGASPILMPVLKRELDDLEALMRETRQIRTHRRSL